MSPAEAIAARLEGQPVERLREMALALAGDFREGTDAVFAAVLAELEGRLPVADFITFAEALA